MERAGEVCEFNVQEAEIVLEKLLRLCHSATIGNIRRCRVFETTAIRVVTVSVAILQRRCAVHYGCQETQLGQRRITTKL